jgi:predicted PurR-regulated permease PerM
MKFKWDKRYVYVGLTAFFVIAASILFFLIISKWSSVLAVIRDVGRIMSPIIIGFVVAYILNPGMRFFENKLFTPLGKRLFPAGSAKVKTFSRVLGMISMFAILLIIVVGITMLVIPQLYTSVEKIVDNIDSYISVVRGWTDSVFKEHTEVESTVLDFVSKLLNYAAEWLQTGVMNRIDTIIINLTSGLKSVLMAIFHFLIGLIVAMYVLYGKERFNSQAKKVVYSTLSPKAANAVMSISRKTDEMFAGFFIGKIVDSAIIGLICAIFTTIVGIPYAPLVSVIVGVTNIIPFFGPYIGAIPCAFIILLESPINCLIFVIFVIILQGFDGNVLGPKILGDKTNLSSFWVVFAILVGGGFFGFAGMICGVPVVAVIFYFCQKWIKKNLEKRGLPTDEESFLRLDTIEEDLNIPIYKTEKSQPEKKLVKIPRKNDRKK